MTNSKSRKIFSKTIVLFLIVVMIFTTSFGPSVRVSRAEDSPEEIAREQEKARRKAERHAQKQQDREREAQEEAKEEQMEDEIDNQQKAEHEAAEAERERLEAEREYLEDHPLPTATPTAVPTATAAPDVAARNTNAGINSTNDASASSSIEAEIEVENSGSLEQELTTVANSGNNTTSDESPPPTATPEPTETPKEPLPDACGDNLKVDNNAGTDEDNHAVDNTASADSSDGGGGNRQQADSTAINASDADSADLDSGGSNNDSVTTNNDEVVVANSTCANIANDEEVHAMSGGNEQVGNEDANIMETGDAQSEARLVNQGNTNQVEVDRKKKAENTDTEDGSSNDTKVENITNLTVDNENAISADNHLKVSAVSGGNRSTDHDGYAKVSTGDIDILVQLLNILNMNITGTDFTHLIINIFKDLNGEVDLDDIADQLGMDEEEIEIIARNSRTGKESHNNAEIYNELNLTVNNNNQANVRNDVDVAGVSGANDVSRDEDLVDVRTGRIKILVAILNFINANFSGSDWYFAMINIFSDLHGDIILPDADGFLVGEEQVVASNDNTGANSNNEATVNDKSVIAASNQNDATVTNKVTVVGDSGSNDAYANDDRVETKAGDVNILNRAMNWLNTNIIGDHWVLLIVNVLGRWMGHVVAFPGKGNIDAPKDGLLVAAAGVGSREGPDIAAENSDTGEGSSNDAKVENINNWQVNNNNQATVENNVNVSGVSGQNTTNENDGRVNIFTGWIDISSGLLNIVNFNVTGRNWLMVMVNVFGDFWGNIVFPSGEAMQSTAGASDKAAPVQQNKADSELAQEANQGVGGLVEEGDYQPNSYGRQVKVAPTPSVFVVSRVADDDYYSSTDSFGETDNFGEEETGTADYENFQEARVTVYSRKNASQDGQLAFLGISGSVLPASKEQLGLALIAAIFIFALRKLPIIVNKKREVN